VLLEFLEYKERALDKHLNLEVEFHQKKENLKQLLVETLKTNE